VQLAHDSAFDIDSFIAARVGESLGRARAAAAMSGTGASQPLGIITALNAKGTAGTVGGAISAVGGFVSLQAAQQTRTLSLTPGSGGETTTRTELASNGLAPSTVLAMIEAVDPAYRALGAKWYLNSNQLSALRSQVDAYGRPFYPSLYDKSPTLVGYDVVVDQNIPSLTRLGHWWPDLRSPGKRNGPEDREPCRPDAP
jgi:HK97 family phage major capsid protein